MKVKAVKGFPEKKTYQNTNEWCNSGAYLAKGFNHALEEVGNLEIDLRELIDWDKMFDIILNQLDSKSRIWVDETAEAIKEQANELVKTKEKENEN